MLNLKPLACGFHSHCDYSLDGGSTVERKLNHAINVERVADCLTDHGIMSGLAPHWFAAQKLSKARGVKIQSIHGIELYVVDEDRSTPEKTHYYHLTVHFKTKAAYEYFCRMSPVMESRALIKYGERKPLMYLRELEPIAGQITIGSGCLMGPVQLNILNGRSDLAKRYYERLRNLAGPGNFFVEVFPHIIDHNWQKPVVDKDTSKIITAGHFAPITEKDVRRDPFAIDPMPDLCGGRIDIQKAPNLFVLEMAKKFKDPVIFSLDDHYGPEEDRVVQEARISNGKEAWRFYGDYSAITSKQAYLKLHEQVGLSQRDAEEMIDNSYLFVESFKDYSFTTSNDRALLPTVEMIYGVQDDSEVVLRRLVDEYGLMPSPDHPRAKEYRQRLESEIQVMRHNGTHDFLPYVLMIEDTCRIAREQGSAYTTRGSAGGVLILYLLKISIIDPVAYDLPFERFLTLGRIQSKSLPDIDTDWADRDEVLKILIKKYGDKIALISTNLCMKLKSSILDAERATNGSVSFDTTRMTHEFKVPMGMSETEWLFGKKNKDTGEITPGFLESEDELAQKLREYIDANPKIWALVQLMLGITKTRGVHAGGVIITPGPVSDYLPTTVSKTGAITSAYEMKNAEAVGAIKYDFLGLTTLKALSISMNALRDNKVIDLEWGVWPQERAAYEAIVHSGKTGKLFQINTNLVKPYAIKVKPIDIRTTAALTALIRPGALDAPSPDPFDQVSKHAADYYVRCSLGQRKPYMIHPDLEPILGSTFGIIVYQEQVMKIFTALGGLTTAEAEGVRRAIGKKIKEELDKLGMALQVKLIERNWTVAQAQKLFDSIIASSNYSFNASHSTAYAAVANNCVWLKHNHPLYFWLGMLTAMPEDLDEMLHECRHLLLPVDAARSHQSDWVVEGDRLRPPLNTVKGCGAATVKVWRDVIDDSQPESWRQFIDSAYRAKLKSSDKKLVEDDGEVVERFSVGSLYFLVYAGAFDYFFPDLEVKNELKTYNDALEYAKKVFKSKANPRKRQKTEMIGMADVINYPTMMLWRLQVNPLTTFDVMPFLESSLTAQGFVYNPQHERVAYSRPSTSALPPAIMPRSWGVLASYKDQPMFDALQKEQYHGYIFGIVTAVRAATYGALNKERLVITLYTGLDSVELTVWPPKNGNKVKPIFKNLTVGTTGIFRFRPNVYRGSVGGSIEDVITISI